LGGIPPHPGNIGGKGGWPFLLSSPLSKFNEEVKNPLCGSPPLSLAKKILLDYLFEGAFQLGCTGGGMS